MQKAGLVRYGVSPAYFVSALGARFGPSDMAGTLPAVSDLGYTSFQAEVYDARALSLWCKAETEALRMRAANLGLSCSVFLAHFLGQYFAEHELMHDTASGLEEMKRVSLAAAEVTRDAQNPIVVVPSLSGSRTNVEGRGVWDAFVQKISEFARVASENGLRFAVEPVPGGMINTSRAFVRLNEQLSQGTAWFLLDTGNLYAAGDDVLAAIDQVRGLIAATHICDTAAGSTSLEPGTGEMNWPRVMRALCRDDQPFSLDVEIACSASQVAEAYSRSIAFLKRHESSTALTGGVPHGKS